MGAPRGRGGGGAGGSRAAQLALAGALTAACGGALQLLKLAALDGAGRELGAPSYAARAAFLVPFGLAKSVGNGLAGVLADRPGVGRARAAAAGWALGAVAPAALLALPGRPADLPAAVAANIFLGGQQGLAWSSLLLVFMDLLPGRAGLAAGACEAIGYTAIAAFAGLYSLLERRGVSCAWSPGSEGQGCRASPPAGASSSGPPQCARPDDWRAACAGLCRCGPYVSRGSPFAQAALGVLLGALVCTLCFLQDSSPRRRRAAPPECELQALAGPDAAGGDGGGGGGGGGGAEEDELRGLWSPASAAGGDGTLKVPGAWALFRRTTAGSRSTALVCLSGFAVNLTTGVAWGLLLAWARDGLGLSGGQRDFVAAAYSFVKGLSQFVTGPLSDWGGRRRPLVLGFAANAAGLMVSALGPRALGPDPAGRFACLVLGSVVIGLGTGLVYPTLAAAIGDHCLPEERGTCVGTFRFWRDLGYTAGALVALLADGTSPVAALASVAAVSVALSCANCWLYREGGAGTPGGGGGWGRSTGPAASSEWPDPASA